MIPKQLLVAICLLPFLGCSPAEPEQELPPMPLNYKPPGVNSLAEIDVAEGVTYSAEPVIVQGVISPSSQHGSNRGEEYQVHAFSLAAWKQPEGTLVEQELLILRAVPPDYEYLDDFPTHSIQRFRVLISDDGERSVLSEILRPQLPDEELAAIADKLQKPLNYHSERFGDLLLDRTISIFEGEAEWNGESVIVHFDEEDQKPCPVCLQTAEQLWAEQAAWQQKIDDYVVEELLELKNEDWLEEGEAKLTRQAFLDRMSLSTISFTWDGEFEFWYDDGDLFWGHQISVRGNLKEGLFDAGISG